MKTLERFWHWVDNETPDVNDVIEKARANLSELALHSLKDAAQMIIGHALPETETRPMYRDDERGKDGSLYWVLGKYPHALKGLSLALCEALEVMFRLVPERTESAPEQPEQSWWKSDSADAFVYALQHSTALIASRKAGKKARIHDLQRMFTEQPLALPRNPVPTSQADGSHCLDVLCSCATYIVKRGGMYVAPSGYHTQIKCEPFTDPRT